MRIAIVTAMDKRPVVTRLFCMRFVKLKTYCESVGIELICCAAVTTGDNESAALCTEFGIRFIPYANKPLGAKWNAAVNFARSFEPRIYVICGDDDLLSMSNFNFDGDIEQYETAYVLCGKECGIMKLKNQGIGSGTSLKAYVVESTVLVPVKWHRNPHNEIYPRQFIPIQTADYLQRRQYLEVDPTQSPAVKMYPDGINSACDFNRDINLTLHGYFPNIAGYNKPQLVCIKSGKNIWDYRTMLMHKQVTPCDFEDGFNLLHDDEKEYYMTHFYNQISSK